MSEKESKLRLRSTNHIVVTVGPPARPIMTIYRKPFPCPPAPKFPKRFNREKRKRLRAAWIVRKQEEAVIKYLYQTAFPQILERSIDYFKELPSIGTYRKPITTEKE